MEVTTSNHLQALTPNGQLPIFVPLAHHFSVQNQSEEQVNSMFYGIPTTVEHNPSLLGMNMPVGWNDIVNNAHRSSSAVDLAGCSFPLSLDSATAEEVNIFNQLYQQNVGNNRMEQSGQNVNASIAELVEQDEGYPGSSYFREPFGHDEDLVSAFLKQVGLNISYLAHFNT